MSFNFGNTSGSTFGSASNRPTAFGAPFGSTPTTSAATGFSGFGSTFGTPAQTQAAPVFGSSTFGAPAATVAPSFGSTFGTPAASAAPAFGSTFGTPVASAAPAFGSTFGTPAVSTATPGFGSTFGTPASGTTSLFGNTATTKPSLFGTPTTSAGLFSTPASSGTGLFGTATTNTPSLFGSNPATSTPSLFGNAPAASTPSLFGSSFGNAPATSTTGGLFGATPAQSAGSTGFNLFGGPATTASSLFSGFGTTTTTPSGFGGFGAGGGFGGHTGGFGGFGTPATTSNLFGNTAFGAKPPGTNLGPVVPDAKAQQIASFYGINVFGDERDEILKKWNLLQACWGTGKGYFSANHPPVAYNHCNPFYRFKAIGYIIIPQAENADGLVKLIFNKKECDVRAQHDFIYNGITNILGNKPNLSITIKSIKASGENESEITIFVTEKGVTGVSRKIHATDLAGFLSQPQQRNVLSTVGCIYVGPYLTPNKTQLEDYLKYPPPGIDQQMWAAAQADNPHPTKYLPTATNGFEDLKKRLLYQEHETGLHRSFLVKVNQDISDLKKKHAASMAQISDLKQKFLQLQHRVLRILVKQEVTRKVGLALQPEEEVLKGRLEMMQAHLNAPSQFRGQINELINNMKLCSQLEVCHHEQYKMDATVQDEIKQFLTMEQNGISHLIKIINSDLDALKIISDGMNQLMMK